MTRRAFENRIRRDLRTAVDTAAPRGTWEDVVARLDRPTGPQPTEDIVMLDTPMLEVDTEPAEPDSPNRRVLVGAISAVLLAAVIGGAVLAGRGDSTVPPADGSSPISTAEDAVEALTSSDRQAFMELFADDAVAYNSAFFNDIVLGRLDDPAIRSAFEGSVDAAAVGWRREPLIDSTCRQDGPRVFCDLTYEGALSGQPEPQRLELRVEDGLITSFRQRVLPVDPAATQGFLDWVVALEPTSANEACAEIDYASTDCAELWYDLVDRYLAERDAG